MCNFIEDYLRNPSQAITDAKTMADRKFKGIVLDDDMIFSQISSPEFNLYEEIVLS